MIGAVNTVSKDETGRLLGDNTDWIAIHQLSNQRLAALGKSGRNGSPHHAGELGIVSNIIMKSSGSPVGLVIGAGGTAHAACYALSQMNAQFYIYNRTSGT